MLLTWGESETQKMETQWKVYTLFGSMLLTWGESESQKMETQRKTSPDLFSIQFFNF
jgi:hypothetical protein